jgi:hypothetical protein
MGNRYEIGLSHATPGSAAAPIVTLVTASGSRAVIREIGIFNVSGVAGEVGIGRPAAAGSGTLTGTLGQALDSADTAALTTLVTSFGTSPPTAPTNPMRRVQIPAVIGAGVIFTYEPQEFIVPISADLVVWQFSTAAVTWDVYFKWAE